MSEMQNELKAYLDADGRLTQLPSKRRKKLCALVWLTDRLPQGRYFTEREFNCLLNELHTFGDPATLRRELFDYWMINREPNGSLYCVNAERPTLEMLIDKYCK